MRIISGYLGGRRLNPPNNLPVRPTTDLARESLFNILRNHVDFETLEVLDLFAGTGSISFEFISRGVRSVTTVDNNVNCINFIKKASDLLEIENLFPIRADVFGFIQKSKKKFDIIFADPPYDLPQLSKIPDLIFEKEMLNENGIFILEHSKGTIFDEHPHLKEHRHYGKVNFSFFR